MEQLRAAGHDAQVDLLVREMVVRNVIPGRSPFLAFAIDPQRRSAFEAEAEAAAEARPDVSARDGNGPAVPRAAAVHVTDQAQFHPRNYVLAHADDVTA
ncbi:MULTISPECIES: hypothetical protein [unclassified Streptomyces]|uniref:hypothetical protein n=1 Tax=Streptomyces sp. NPDC055082 TaxID=3365718 RepID=UPI0037D971DC